MLALSDTGPGFGPEISDTAIHEAFGTGWELEGIDLTQYRGVVTEHQAPELDLLAGKTLDVPAWLATARRL